MSKSLYKYALDESNGNIIRTEITVYEELETENRYTGNRNYLKYKDKGQIHYVDVPELDRVKAGRVHTFNSDMEYAKRLIMASLIAKQAKAEDDVKRWKTAINRLEDSNNVG